jgi:exopolysaccharide biosynthesis protein
VIDGRQNAHSIGITLPELGELMLSHGASDALNLDGGGSSTLIFLSEGGQVTNRPSDGKFRGVGNHLGIQLRDP